ncbi:MAG: hypothetical protein A3G33_05020 [Omnitrophica bacterium RIFCSPLOWO2_12_FULL_44_17]|uniref:Uncharacterized protein n=1 Tax=Candidatus Danuiimicrobium aquiferis TaxID=1801832 RepID=A0A1G1KX55_9BACT|nr:MAG: hypothetical protein A3B72_01390 [Omnitrophica bacterium RIFCSPHIGHO2_02_FULL_45_28]OGW89139.1 MAG: hypothetical protein A3E74_06185 [Omnitrophica bacterium RIFCSPHIGHO2_12_FULL_44_12]OGW97518.1 MAG: hypothetical protein A3G33_05020 [Omnitrophica bacterium RIFCSPLOWO2_12_FULL_44_17]OGX02072.1 MAG: hypothetical protein A3J12_06315 [Omnitrophica bacterium RIFCSPLOWO2_02_FULL_44_11]
MKRKKYGWVLVIACIFAMLVPNVFAQTEQPLMLKVTVIVASNQGSEFTMDNDNYRDELVKLFSYKSYKQVKDYLVELLPAENELLNIEGGYMLALNSEGEKDGKFLVRMVIQKDGRQFLNTEITVTGEVPVFMGGPSVQNGVLILAVEKR